ncbi:hypothetical protein [Geodermatophilus sp. URMC 64]
MRWSEDRSTRPLSARWTAALVAAAGVGFALVGGLTVTAPAGSQRPDDGSSLRTDPATEPTGRGGLPHGEAAPTSTVPEAPVVPSAPQPAPPGTTTAPSPEPVAVPAADAVGGDSPGKPCPAEGSVAVTAADRPLVCILGGSGQLRWRVS